MHLRALVLISIRRTLDLHPLRYNTALCVLGLLASATVATEPPRAQAQDFVPGQETAPYAERRQVFVGLPLAKPTANGQLNLMPNVNVSLDPTAPPVEGRATYQPTVFAGDLTQSAFQPPVATTMPADEMLPPPEQPIAPGSAQAPIFQDIVREQFQPRKPTWRDWWLAGRYGEPGLGRERLAHAPFELDSSQPLANVLFRFNLFQDQQYPDRAEYLWARETGRGPPLPESNLDYQEMRIRLELGNKKFSTATEFPLRWTNPENNVNHAGFGDMRLTIKTVFLDGKCWQLTQIFRSYFPTGSPSMGLGTGHVSLEPGALGRYIWSERTYLHGEIKYFFPIAADPMFGGQVLNYGVGASHVLYERDEWAFLPVLEFVGSSVLNGAKTEPNGLVSPIDGDHILMLMPGLRVARDSGSDLGLFEYGLSTGFPLTSPRFYDAMVRFDFRWSF